MTIIFALLNRVSWQMFIWLFFLQKHNYCGTTDDSWYKRILLLSWKHVKKVIYLFESVQKMRMRKWESVHRPRPLNIFKTQTLFCVQIRGSDAVQIRPARLKVKGHRQVMPPHSHIMCDRLPSVYSSVHFDIHLTKVIF